MIVKFFENKYIPKDKKHLICFPELDPSKYPLDKEAEGSQVADGIEISYGDNKILLPEATLRSDDVMCCELDISGAPVRIYLLNIDSL